MSTALHDVGFHDVDTINKLNQLSWQLLNFLWSRDPPPGGTAVSPISMATALCILKGFTDGEPPASIESILQSLPSSPMVTWKKGVFAVHRPTFSLNFANAVSRYGPMMVVREPNSFEGLIDGIDRYFMSGDADQSIDMQLSPESLAASYDATSASSHIVLANALMISLPLHYLFPPSQIMRSTFNSLDGTTAQIDMMYCSNKQLLVKHQAEYTAVRLPFGLRDHRNGSLIAYLPRNGHSVEHILNSPSVQASSTEGFTKTFVSTFVMPKFHTKARYNLKDILPLLGLSLPRRYANVTTDGDTAVDQMLQGVSVVFDRWGIHDTQPPSPPTLQCNLPRMDSLSFNSPFVFTIDWRGLDLPLLHGVFNSTEND